MLYLDYNEKTSHGTPDFPLADYPTDKDHPRYHMPFHWHKEAEILYVHRGRFTIYLNDTAYEVNAGDIAFIHPGVTHGGVPEDCEFDCLVFDGQTLFAQPACCRHLWQRLMESNLQINSLILQEEYPEVCEAARRLIISARGTIASSANDSVVSTLPSTSFSSDLAKAETLGALLTFFSTLERAGCYQEESDRGGESSLRIDELRPVLEYIGENYMHPISLETLAALVDMNPKYFCRFFNTCIHRTPIDYLNFYRIERACALLTAGTFSVTETAYRCGFNDSSYFVRIFRKYKGVTPRQYQKHPL